MPDQKYHAKDFLLDEEFLQWVKSPTAAREAYWQHFLLLHPEAEQPMKEARMMLEQLNFKEQVRTASAKVSIKERIDIAIREQALTPWEKDRPLHSSLTRNLYPKTWIGIAAAVSGLVLLASIYFIFYASSGHTQYITTYGERKTITLPDQSVVTLNANSSLTLQKSTWSRAAERTVWLEGEAYFEVEKKKTPEGKAAKFIVHTGNVNVEVLGTSFNVNARRQKTSVVLSSGSVQLNFQQEIYPEKAIMMKPGDMVAVNKGEVVRKIVDTSHYTAWKENKLIFEQTPVAEIIQLIEDNYGLRVSVQSPSLLEREFTGAAPADQLDILLDKMSVVYNLNITRNEREIIITNP